jgi:membrane-bound ClpP family serine protease
MTLIVSLILIALIFFISELFVPGIILGSIGVCLLLIAVVQAQVQFGVTAALITFLISLVLSLGFIFLEMTFLRKTSLGRKFRLETNFDGESSNKPQSDGVSLLGKKGLALTIMAPSGSVEIEGTVYEARSQSGYVAKGATVEVVFVDVFRVVVREIAAD